MGTDKNTGLAWWSGSFSEFLDQDPHQIADRLSHRAIETHAVNRTQQLQAWDWQIRLLKTALRNLPTSWRVVFEYPLIRLGRRLDCVLVTDRAIMVIEFKALNSGFSAAARAQAEDYAFDLRDFHAGSRDRIIIPIVVAETGRPCFTPRRLPLPGVTEVFEAHPDGLATLLHDLAKHYPTTNLGIAAWEDAPYRPVPTIIEAARMLYAKHGVADIRNARADTDNLSKTTNAILAAIIEAKTNGTFIILFVTGIPGAGKTLCGLNAVFSSETDGTFLTGTLPMVYVLSEALAMDTATRKNISKAAAQQEVKGKIQSITGFLRDNIRRSEPTAEHVIVFDEAQRAWDADYGATKFQHTDSEAGIVLDIMARHTDYAVIVALVGTGQEINTGEAGLAAWGDALAQRPQWQIRSAPGVLTAQEPKQRLFSVKPASMQIDPALHLGVAIRNVRSEAAAYWVDAVLRGQADQARAHAQDLPFYVTRSMAHMRAVLRARARGNRRSGLVCSSGAKRLIADGLWPKFEHMDSAMVANWFLKSWPDVRASDALEIPATEFACQGLELDFVGLCWGGDVTWQGQWVVQNFSGSRWQKRHKAEDRAFQLNTYRVLMTRARCDTFIWVPPGDPGDETRAPGPLDRTAEFLLSCGATWLNEVATEDAAINQKTLL